MASRIIEKFENGLRGLWMHIRHFYKDEEMASFRLIGTIFCAFYFSIIFFSEEFILVIFIYIVSFALSIGLLGAFVFRVLPRVLVRGSIVSRLLQVNALDIFFFILSVAFLIHTLMFVLGENY